MDTCNATLEDPTHSSVVSSTPSVTVVVPVRNEEAHLAATLDQLIDQDTRGIVVEIIVVDGESTDQTVAIAKKYAQQYPWVRVLTNPQRLSSAARNLAIRESQSDYFIVIDGHCEVPSRRYFQDLVKAFEESGADCVGRPQPLEVSEATPLQRAIALARSSRLGHHPESFIYSDTAQFVPAKSVAVAYRREVFEKVGLFDENFDAHEDGEFNFRCDEAGLKCYLDPKLTVKYHPRQSLGSLFKQMVRYGRGRVRLARKHRGTLPFSTVIPPLFVFGLLSGPLIAAALPILWSAYFACILIYISVVLGESLRLAFTAPEMKGGLYLPAVFGAVHTGSGVGFLLEYLRQGCSRRASDSRQSAPGPQVLIVAASPRYVGGQSVMAQRLIQDLASDGVVADFLAVDPILPPLLKPLDRVKYVRTLVRSAFYFLALVRQVPTHDVIHIFSASYSAFLVSAAPALIAAKTLGKSAILNYHSGEAEDHLAHASIVTTVLLRCANTIVVPSGYLQDVFKRFGLESTAIPNHVDTNFIDFRERHTVTPHILVSRNLEPLYNIECALRAFQIVQERCPSAMMTILGDGTQRLYLEQLADDLSLCHVNFTGCIARSDIARYYDAADIFLNTSSIDNMPVSIIEAFVAGLPVVTTNAGGIPYMVSDRRNGHMVQVNDHAAIAQRLLDVIESPDEWRRLSIAGRSEARKYSWATVGPMWKQLYATLTNVHNTNGRDLRIVSQ